VLRLELIGANPNSDISGQDELPGKTNYFIGKSERHTTVPTYGKVRYRRIYPGTDLVFYGNQQQLEYDFELSPGTDPAPIRMKISGAERVLAVDAAGNAYVTGGTTSTVFPTTPDAYQTMISASGGVFVTKLNSNGVKESRRILPATCLSSAPVTPPISPPQLTLINKPITATTTCL
jgi:hypothetical protein